MIEIMVLPAVEMEGKNITSDTLVISIVSPGVIHPKIDGEHVYKFNFHDVTEEYFLDQQNKIIRPMEYEIAESIVEICMNHRDKKKWIIHCEAGISRSPGVAIGLARYIDLSINVETLVNMFPCYNKHVQSNIEKAMRAKLLEIELNLRERSMIDPHGF